MCEYPLTLQMLSLVALDELRIAATHRAHSYAGDPRGRLFLGPVRTQAYWAQPERQHRVIRRASASFRLGELVALFDMPIKYPLLERLEMNLASTIWMIAHDLQIVDGSSFVDLPDDGLEGPVYTACDTDVAVRMNIDRERGQFRLTAAVV